MADSEQYNNLIHNLRALRRRYGLTKKSMARLMGITEYSLGQLENGVLPKAVGMELLFRMQACFGIAIRELFERRL